MAQWGMAACKPQGGSPVISIEHISACHTPACLAHPADGCSGHTVLLARGAVRLGHMLVLGCHH